MSAPTVSVVMPAFNAADTIDVALAALARQRGTPSWELIVADNGSTDDTIARVGRWTDRIPDLTVVDAAARRGPSAARNLGAAAAKGGHLLFCDADDAAHPEWIAELWRALGVADAVSGARAYDELNRRAFGPADWRPPIFAKAPLVGLAAASSHNLGVRRFAFNAVSGFDERLTTAEDVDFCWRLQLAGFTFAAAPGAIVQIRRRTGLGAIARQAYAYGRGDRMLAARFAEIRSGRDGEPRVVTVGTANAAPASPASAGASRVVSSLEFRVHRASYRLARTFGTDTAPPLPQEVT